jgi:hypothetical protein
LPKNAWMLRTRSRTEYGGPSWYRWRRSGSDLRMNARTALGFSRYKPNGQRCNSNSRLNPTTTRRNRLPQLGVCISVALLEICFVHLENPALGCESIGFRDDYEKHEVLLAFTHRGRNIQLRASAKGWAQVYLKESPWTYSRRSTRHTSRLPFARTHRGQLYPA